MLRFLPARCAFFASLLVCFVAPSLGQSLKITSTPAGAKVDLDGVAAGTTPLEKTFPGGYFHRTHTVIGQRLEHPMIARVSLPGYATHEIALTEGPMQWIDIHGRNHGQYWLFKSDHFEVQLDPVGSTFTGAVTAALTPEASASRPELSLEEIVRRTKPAVVYLKALDKSGTGFFVTDTGVLATNAHVARGDSSFVAVLPDGVQLDAKIVFIDADLDIALAKVVPPSPDYVFPHLPLADATSVRQGESVLAIGNPGDAMLFSVTKGIVSAVGKFSAAGPGTWIQTDAPINPGNSGGPLLNTRGEVIGLSTLKVITKNVTGIGFALSSNDLVAVLRKFYPDLAPGTATTATEFSADLSTAEVSSPSNSPSAVPAFPSVTDGFGVVTISSDPDAAEIYIDGKFVGNTPATLKLSTGAHTVLLKSKGFADYSRTLEMPRSSKLSLKVDLSAQSEP
jgi:S1-C subfamily serine protease